MKLKDLLNEDATVSVARFYIEANSKFDKKYNPDVSEYKSKNSKYYEEHFKQWFNEEVTPVFTKPIDKPHRVYDTAPEKSKLQSPGYRGLQYALQAAGLPYNHNVQKYEENPSRVIVSQAMDSLNTNN